MLPWGDELQASPVGIATPSAWVPGTGPGHLVAEWASMCLMPTSTTPCPVQAMAPDLVTRSLPTGEGGDRSPSALWPQGHF